MITNFEEITSHLTKEELKLVPMIVSKFKKHSVKNPIKSNEMIRFINKSQDIKLNGVRLRKICNHIRTNSIMPLIATSRGYYQSKSKVEISKQIKSLLQRSKAITKCGYGLSKFLN